MNAISDASRELAARIRDELRIVLDPEIGRSVVDVGLIYAIDVADDGAVAVDMTTTTRGCPAAGFLVSAVRECILDAGLASAVEVRLVYDPPWTPDMMAD
jgi:metal-sulfur cluster biosynthetic enzyme